MKRTRITVTVLLLFALLFSSGCAQAEQPEEDVASEEVTQELTSYDFQDFPPNAYPQQASSTEENPERLEGTLFNAKFEGDAVSGSGRAVGGVYHFIATQTDGEAWHVKLEANYPTIAGRDYHVTYNFHSDVAGTVKFGDFQEFQIHEGDNSITGIFTAKDSTSYVDLQLGMLPAFTIDFTEIEVKEYADEVEYENALPKPVNFARESIAYETHDQGYDTVLVRSDHAINVNYESIPVDIGVWKSRLYVRTGMVPEPGARYRVTADIMSDRYDRNIAFELLLNDGEVEKGYGALYGQQLVPGEVKTCEAVIMGNGNGDELILQFSLGEARAGSVIIVGNVHVDKIIDEYTSALPDGFALDNSVFTGRMIEELVPVSYRNMPLGISYTSLDTVYEQHDDGYVVYLTEGADSATMRIAQAPTNPDDRGVWKAKLYAATGAELQPGKSYLVQFDLDSTGNQADYEVCFDGNAENAYGALYGRSLTAGGTDHVQMLITPDAAQGPLTIRIQLGKTDTASGNTVTLKNLSVESVDVSYTSVMPAFSYDTGTAPQPSQEYKNVLPDDFSYTTVNVKERHAEGYTQEATADGTSATLNITEAPEEGRDLWNSNLLIDTGITPEDGVRYVVSFDITAEKDEPNYEACFDGESENSYGALYSQSLAAGETKTITHSFTKDTNDGPLVIRLQLGQTVDTTGNSITVSNLKIYEVLVEESDSLLTNDFKYPVTTDASTVVVPAQYVAQPVTLSANPILWDGSDGSASATGSTATLNVTTGRNGGGMWSIRLQSSTGVTLEPGVKYRVRGTISSEQALNTEVLYSNGHDENDEFNPGGKGYADGTWGLHIDAGGSVSFEKEFTVPEGLSQYNPLVLRVQVGDTTVPNTITLSNVTVEKWVPEHEEQSGGSVTPNSFELWSHETYATTLGGDGNSATVHVDAEATSALEAWKTKLFANTGVTLTGGKSYRISADVQAEQDLAYEICYNDGGTEKGVGAKYDLTATSTAQTVTFDVTPENDASLVIQFSLGNAASGNTVTVSNVKVVEIVETEGENLMTDELVAWAPVHEWSDPGYDVNLTNTDSSATMEYTSVPSDQSDWKSKLYVETGAQLEAGKSYRVRYDVTADSDFKYNVFYNNGAEEKAVGEFYDIMTGTSVEHEVSPGIDSVLNIQLMLGMSSAPNNVTVSNVQVDEIVGKDGSAGSRPPVNAFVHEGYAASLSNTSSSATMAITSVPSSGREAWKIKLFAETGAELTAGETYRVTVDVQTSDPITYDICYNDPTRESDKQEAALGARYGLESSGGKETITYTITPDQDGELILQLNLGNASGKNNVTISNIKVEKVSYSSAKSVIPNFRYDSVGWVSRASDPDYVTSLDRANSSATFHIHQAPAERHTWCAKVNVRTGVVPKPGMGYRVTVNVDAAQPQNKFEIFFDGNQELAYDGLYEQTLHAGRNTFTYTIMPGDSKGELVLQLRFGETNSTAGNTYTISGVQVEEVTFVTTRRPEIKNTVENDTQPGYDAVLSKTSDRAWLQILRTPGEDGLEAWKNKLFVYTGVVLEPGQKYRVSFKVSSIVPAPFEVCFNNGDVEKGLGAIFGLTSKPYGEFVEYYTYVDEDSPLVVQVSLGNVSAPNTIFLDDVKVEKAGEIKLVSDKVYYF